MYFMYQVLSISKFFFITNNFGGTDVVRKVGNFIILLFFSYRLCNLSLQYNDYLQNAD